MVKKRFALVRPRKAALYYFCWQPLGKATAPGRRAVPPALGYNPRPGQAAVPCRHSALKGIWFYDTAIMPRPSRGFSFFSHRPGHRACSLLPAILFPARLACYPILGFLPAAPGGFHSPLFPFLPFCQHPLNRPLPLALLPLVGPLRLHPAEGFPAPLFAAHPAAAPRYRQAVCNPSRISNAFLNGRHVIDPFGFQQDRRLFGRKRLSPAFFNLRALHGKEIKMARPVRVRQETKRIFHRQT